jgi:hypothetical protein
MEFVKLKKDEKGYFFPHDSSSIELSHIAFFLTDDAGHHSNSFKEWALNPDVDFTASNYARLLKEENYILIGDQYSEEPDLGPYLKITIEEFIKILDQWEQFCKNPPNEVLITRENNEIKMEGKY